MNNFTIGKTYTLKEILTQAEPYEQIRLIWLWEKEGENRKYDPEYDSRTEIEYDEEYSPCGTAEEIKEYAAGYEWIYDTDYIFIGIGNTGRNLFITVAE